MSTGGRREGRRPVAMPSGLVGHSREGSRGGAIAAGAIVGVEAALPALSSRGEYVAARIVQPQRLDAYTGAP